MGLAFASVLQTLYLEYKAEAAEQAQKEMPVAIAHLVTYKSGTPDTILSQTVGYKERELDRSPPEGFLSVRILDAGDDETVLFLTEWESEEALAEVRDSAPWEACMDLNETFADDVAAATFKIVS